MYCVLCSGQCRRSGFSGYIKRQAATVHIGTYYYLLKITVTVTKYKVLSKSNLNGNYFAVFFISERTDMDDGQLKIIPDKGPSTPQMTDRH